MVNDRRRHFPKVSIVTITRDDHDLLASTLKSVATQNYASIEYLIVNGGNSVDNLVCSVQFPSGISVKILNGYDKGIYSAMNAALGSISGEWVNFMNAGDTFDDPSSVASVFEHIDRSKSIAVMRLRGEAECQRLWHGLILKNICQQAIFYNRRKIFSSLRFDESYRFSADLELLTRIYASDTENFCTCRPNATVNYLPGGVSGRNQNMLFQEKLRILKGMKVNKNLVRILASLLHLYSVKVALFLKRPLK